MKKINIYRILWPIILFLFSLGQLQRVQLSQNIAFYLHDLFILSWTGIFILSTLEIPPLKKTIKQNSLFFTFTIWSLLILILTQILGRSFNIKPYLYFGRILTYLLFAFSLTQLRKQLTIEVKDNQLNLIKIGLIFISVSIVLLGFLQYILMPDGRHLARYGWDVHYYRLMGLYLDPNFTGLLIVLSLINLLQIKTTNPFQNKKPNLFYLIGGFVSAVLALLLTYSRSCYLVFLCSTFLLSLEKIYQKKKQEAAILILTIFTFLALLPFLPNPGGAGVNLKRISTIKSRVDTNADIIKDMTTPEWFVGQGLFRNRIIYQTEQPHAIHAHFPDSIIIFILSGTGLIGLILFGLSLWQSFNNLKEDRLKLILVAAFLIHNLFNLSLIEPFTLILLLIGLGL